MRRPDPVHVLELFPEERAALLALLAGLGDADWERPTACAGWSVRDVVAHVLGGDLGNLSRRRDGHWTTRPAPGESVVALVNRANDDWQRAAQRLSPMVLQELLAVSGAPLFAYFASLDPMAIGGPVSWAGPGPAPVWLDAAREYTERWHHQQHVRDAVGRPGFADPRHMAPVLATFVHALPVAYQPVDAPAGTAVQFHVRGASGGDWSVVREPAGWTLYAGAPSSPAARVDLDQDAAWRLFTRGIPAAEAQRAVTLRGDERLARHVFQAVAIIA